LPRIFSSLLLGVLLVVSTWTVSASNGQATKPVEQTTTHPDFIAPPSSLNETMLSTDLVLRGRVIGGAPRDKPHAGNRGTWIRTGHRVKVLEVFRAPAGIDLEDREITVMQSGGDRDRGNHIERLTTARFPLLEKGQEYVLFLERADVSDWGSAYGPDGVFENVDDRVRPFGTSQVAARQRNLQWTEFLKSLRNFGVGEGPQ